MILLALMKLCIRDFSSRKTAISTSTQMFYGVYEKTSGENILRNRKLAFGFPETV
jgi:hypothetical protein